MKRCLILSHGFNMDGRAASQTITDKIPYLVNAGIDVYVLSAITGEKDTRFKHAQLLAWGPSAFRFDFRHWYMNRFGRGASYKFITFSLYLFLMPFILIEKILIGLSSQWSWSIPAIIRGYWWIYRFKIDTIYSTGGAWSAHLAGYFLKKMTNCQWIVEVHDPLVIRRELKSTKKLSINQRREEAAMCHLEGLISKNANLVWFFTKGALDWFLLRYPEIKGFAFSMQPGSSPPVLQKVSYVKGGKLIIGHFGVLSNTRSLLPILRVLPIFFKRNQSAKKIIEIKIFGSDIDQLSKEWLAVNLEYEENISIVGRINSSAQESGRNQIFKYMQKCDYLLLLHGDHLGCEEYIPSKIYDYWWTQRPIIAFTHRNQELNDLINKINGHKKYTVEMGNDIEALETLEKAWLDWGGGINNTAGTTPMGVENLVKKIIQNS